VSSPPLIAVDIGNSTVKVGMLAPTPIAGPNDQGGATSFAAHAASELELRSCQLSLTPTSHDHDWLSNLLSTVDNWLLDPELRDAKPISGAPTRDNISPASRPAARWFVASVNQPIATLLRQQLFTTHSTDVWKLLTRRDVELDLDVRHPDAVGIDRLIGGKGALKFASEGDVILVDAGSAVTIDLLRENRFLGGAILPGLRLQLDVLNRSTAQLPLVDPALQQQAAHAQLELPGRDTSAAMRSGVLMGLAGGIDRIAYEYGEQCGKTPTLVLTGGDALPLSRLIRHRCLVEEKLVLKTILRIAAGGRVK